jgi:glucose/arabinose dehydrogenase
VLATAAGIWRFDTGKRNQKLADGTRIATGLRAPLALAVNPRDTTIYAVTHGPDSLHEHYPQIDARVAATHPGDEMIRVSSIKADYGWPYCYYDVILGTRVQSPEYGGDGRTPGACDRLIRPVMSFPAHWEPMAMVFASGQKFPEKYRDGAFVAFHGSSHRAPLPEDGYAVAFVPFRKGVPSMNFELFADGFAGAMKSATGARSRPAGLALGPDGSLYVSDDKGGRIWRITYKGK